MDKDFVKKLETENYIIGSFDTYIENAKDLIEKNSIPSDIEEDILKKMPTAYRASILDKQGNYIGFIGLYDVDSKNGIASIRFEANNEISEEHKKEILDEFKKYIFDSLNITQISETVYKALLKIEINRNIVVPNTNIVLSSNLLIPGVKDEDLERFKEDYNIPRLQMPYTIKSNDKVIGIIGLSSLIWSNRRANLNIYLDKSLGDEITNELSGYIIDEYIDYVHNSNVHNITLSVNGSDKNMLKILEDTNMNYYGEIPYGASSGKHIESNFMFQHIPHMKKENGILLPENKIAIISNDKKTLAPKMYLDNGYKLVSPKIFEDENIDFNHVLNGHMSAMENRDKFTMPLGEDKYFLQKGNEFYGLYKALANYTYIILNDHNDYCGFINIIRENANGRNAEIEIGVDPSIQNKGLGTVVINKFYDELFKAGYLSVTSSVFEFNNPSIRLHEKVAELNGVRLESYYINGKLWDMNIYSKTNDSITRHL